MPRVSDADVGTHTSHLQTLPFLACLQQYSAKRTKKHQLCLIFHNILLNETAAQEYFLKSIQ